MTVSESKIYVNEGSMPPRVICTARSYPEPVFSWVDKNNKTIAKGNALMVNKALFRNDAGTYKCVAHNKHGSSEAEFFMMIRCE